MSEVRKCPNCQITMQATWRKADDKVATLSLCLVIGGCVFFCLVPLIGWICGPILIIHAMGLKREFCIWKCNKCGKELERQIVREIAPLPSRK